MMRGGFCREARSKKPEDQGERPMVKGQYGRLKNIRLQVPHKNGAYRHERLRQVKILAQWLAMDFHAPETKRRSGGGAVRRFAALLERRD
jgi:hypothetical protein